GEPRSPRSLRRRRRAHPRAPPRFGRWGASAKSRNDICRETTDTSLGATVRPPDPRAMASFMIEFMLMKTRVKISKGGQISIPATIRHRWGTSTVALDDQGDRVRSE